MFPPHPPLLSRGKKKKRRRRREVLVRVPDARGLRRVLHLFLSPLPRSYFCNKSVKINPNQTKRKSISYFGGFFTSTITVAGYLPVHSEGVVTGVPTIRDEELLRSQSVRGKKKKRKKGHTPFFPPRQPPLVFLVHEPSKRTPKVRPTATMGETWRTNENATNNQSSSRLLLRSSRDPKKKNENHIHHLGVVGWDRWVF